MDEAPSVTLAAEKLQHTLDFISGAMNICPDGVFPITPSSMQQEKLSRLVTASAGDIQESVPYTEFDQEDEPRPLLDADEPGSEADEEDTLIGFGLIRPVFARLDLPIRHVRRAGTTARRAWQSLHGQQFNRARKKKHASSPTASSFASSEARESCAEDAQGRAGRTAACMCYPTERSLCSTGSWFGVMQPVSFARPSRQDIWRALFQEMEDESQTECAAWTDEDV